jgi:hypothetical protein
MDLDKFGADVVPLGTTLRSYFLCSTISNTNMADEKICEVGSTLAPPATGSHSDIRLDFREIQNFGKNSLCNVK